MWPLLICGVLLFLAVLKWDLWSDKEKYLEGNYFFNHTEDGLLRLMLLIPSMVCFGLFQSLTVVIVTPFMVCFLYWFWFDGLYNHTVLKKWFFGTYGTTSKLDRFLRNLTWVGAFVLKITLILISTSLYLKNVKL